jgi:SAM-dependent methyltransferase
MSGHFYTQLEQSFRGGRSEIKERLQFYVPFVLSMQAVDPQAKVLDLGCGRGEWLELLRELKVQASGVDLDDGMLSDCRNLNLKVTTQDAVSALNALDDASVSMVSAFHLVEHLPFDVLRTLTAESFRVLKPGGLFIVETPNPDNIQVGTANFYLDPTHTRPIPMGLLKFLPQYDGFHKVVTFGLQESPALHAKTSPSLKDVFLGASPDYAVVAQKAADATVLKCFSAAFDQAAGLTTETLIDRYDERIAREHQELAQAISLLNVKLSEIYASNSWKITQPLRLLGQRLRQIKDFLKGRR